MAAIKSLLMDVTEGRVTLDQASVILGHQNPDIEYTPDQLKVLELMAAENELNRNDEYYEQMGREAEDERIAELGFINDL